MDVVILMVSIFVRTIHINSGPGWLNELGRWI
jgi:hypothetical protein